MLGLLIFSTILLFAVNFLAAWITVTIGKTHVFNNPHLRLVFYLTSALFFVLGLMQMVANFFASRPQFLSQKGIDLWSTIAFVGSLLSYAAGMFYTSKRIPENT